MKIVALKYGESLFGENFIFKGGQSNHLLPISFVIYLIQTKDKNILVDVGCDDGAGFEMSIFKKPVDVLKDYGIKPSDITDIIITHSHHDHVEAIGHYKNAVIYIQKDEYYAAKKYIPVNITLNIFGEECNITTDVFVKKIGGHSIGSSIVIVGNYLFCGDECYVEENLTQNRLSGSVYCEEKHKGFLSAYGKSEYIPLLFHDPSIMTGVVGHSIIYQS